ncbi:MAG: single-stranded-DNA-specific exonuclease RecJ [Sumerlaeia bacterium]
MSPPSARSKRHVLKRWTLQTICEARSRELARALRLHPAVARLLVGRGWTDPSLCQEFIGPRLGAMRDPFDMHDMDRAVERILSAIQKGEKICVFGDYDVDGVTSTALMVLTLRFLGADPAFFIPHRVEDGYGFGVNHAEDLARDGVQLLITVDCGIGAIAPVTRANELGMDVVVTDHHLVGEELPPARAVLNPNRPDAPYPGGMLCGAGTAYKLAHGLLKSSGRPPEDCKPFLLDLLDLVALGTIADMVPLENENRVFAAHGLKALHRTQRPGLRALMHVTNCQGDRLCSEDVGFRLGPRINAAGRTDHAATALELLLTGDEKRASEIAVHLDELNNVRRAEERAILKSAMEQADAQMESKLDNFLVVSGADYHIGVVGIVASRLVEQFHRPAVVLREDPDGARGSARSIPGYDVHATLSHCGAHLIKFGGHAAAAGLEVAPRNLDAFREAANEHARAIFEERDLSPEIAVDAELAPDDMCWDFYNDVQRLQPYGQDNPSPVFLLRGVSCPSPPTVVGQTQKHLKMRVRSGNHTWGAIGFNLAHLRDIADSSSRPFDIVFRPQENTFRGTTNLEMEVVDLKPSV